LRGVKATKQSLVRKRLKIASLSLAMTITYADTLMKRYTSYWLFGEDFYVTFNQHK